MILVFKVILKLKLQVYIQFYFKNTKIPKDVVLLLLNY